jgi:hypothetical protein
LGVVLTGIGGMKVPITVVLATKRSFAPSALVQALEGWWIMYALVFVEVLS